MRSRNGVQEDPEDQKFGLSTCGGWEGQNDQSLKDVGPIFERYLGQLTHRLTLVVSPSTKFSLPLQSMKKHLS